MNLIRIAALAALTLPLYSQTLQNSTVWLVYNGDHAIAGSKWGTHLEGHVRRAETGRKWAQLLLRGGVNYQLSSSVALSGGYTFLQTRRWSAIPLRATIHENRAYEQISYNLKLWNHDVSHRARIEQGWMSTGYQNRARYQGRTTFPLGDRHYIALADEVFFNFGRNVDRNVFDQNRATISIGRDLGHQTRVEFGYTEQTLQRRGGRIFENNHVLQVTINSRIPIF